MSTTETERDPAQGGDASKPRRRPSLPWPRAGGGTSAGGDRNGRGARRRTGGTGGRGGLGGLTLPLLVVAVAFVVAGIGAIIISTSYDTP
ncbi:MAG: hypothetical protein QOF76_3142, partial [Solirubrobacteraceae bacterium]|nr:hypothetical protein [Solirubrobacteraceae bacterium]